MRLSPRQADEAGRALAGASPEQIVRWAWELFRGEAVLSSSFQPQSLPLLHIVSRVAPQMPVLFLDTGHHFEETLAFRDRIVGAWALNLQVVRPDPDLDPGGDLHRSDPQRCCYLRKVVPMRRALEQYRAWVTGIRPDQTPERSGLQPVEWVSAELVRVHPLASWRAGDVQRYREEHQLPRSPLSRLGYESVGCAPCTAPPASREQPREGRWPGTGQTECGLHTDPGLRAAQAPGDVR